MKLPLACKPDQHCPSLLYILLRIYRFIYLYSSNSTRGYHKCFWQARQNLVGATSTTITPGGISLNISSDSIVIWIITMLHWDTSINRSIHTSFHLHFRINPINEKRFSCRLVQLSLSFRDGQVHRHFT